MRVIKNLLAYSFGIVVTGLAAFNFLHDLPAEKLSHISRNSDHLTSLEMMQQIRNYESQDLNKDSHRMMLSRSSDASNLPEDQSKDLIQNQSNP